MLYKNIRLDVCNKLVLLLLNECYRLIKYINFKINYYSFKYI